MYVWNGGMWQFHDLEWNREKENLVLFFTFKACSRKNLKACAKTSMARTLLPLTESNSVAMVRSCKTGQSAAKNAVTSHFLFNHSAFKLVSSECSCRFISIMITKAQIYGNFWNFIHKCKYPPDMMYLFVICCLTLVLWIFILNLSK